MTDDLPGVWTALYPAARTWSVLAKLERGRCAQPGRNYAVRPSASVLDCTAHYFWLNICLCGDSIMPAAPGTVEVIVTGGPSASVTWQNGMMALNRWRISSLIAITQTFANSDPNEQFLTCWPSILWRQTSPSYIVSGVGWVRRSRNPPTLLTSRTVGYASLTPTGYRTIFVSWGSEADTTRQASTNAGSDFCRRCSCARSIRTTAERKCRSRFEVRPAQHPVWQSRHLLLLSRGGLRLRLTRPTPYFTLL